MGIPCNFYILYDITMDTKKTFYIWLFDKDSKQQKIGTIEAYKIIENLVIANFQYGGTIYQSQGIYKHDNGAVVIEPSLVVVYTQEKHEQFVMDVKKALNQESVLVDITKSNISFE